MRKALVTGGSRGIGEAIAEVLRAQGVEVVTPWRNELDLSDSSSIDRFTEKYREVGFDILVNNAGINLLSSLDDLSDVDWQQMVQINLTAPMQLMQAFTPGMKARGWGRVVNVSSVFALVTKEKRISYSATKSGLLGATRTAAVELAPYGVLVNAVCPGYVETELTRQNNSPQDLAQIAESIPMQRLAKPFEIASFVAFLCSEQNTYLTGQTIAVDGGFTCK